MTTVYECFICDKWLVESEYLKHMTNHSAECELPGNLNLPAVMTPEVVDRWSMIGILKVREEDIPEPKVVELGLTLAM